jgi:hypothetical protein
MINGPNSKYQLKNRGFSRNYFEVAKHITMGILLPWKNK